MNRFRKISTPGPPAAGTLTPSSLISGAGKAENLISVYTHPAGYANIQSADLLVGPENGKNAIWLSYNMNADRLFIYDNTGRVLTGGCLPGSSDKIMNSQGTLDCKETKVTGNGTSLMISWHLIPKPAFASPEAKKIWLIARDRFKRNSGWVLKGTWTVR